jgi:hypothetical protein
MPHIGKPKYSAVAKNNNKPFSAVNLKPDYFGHTAANSNNYKLEIFGWANNILTSLL